MNNCVAAEKLKKNGFIIYKKFLSDNEINSFKKYIESTENSPEYYEPFYKKVSPVRQYIDIHDLNRILNNKEFINKSNTLLTKLTNREDIELTYSTVLFKDKWYGSEEHWHQDGYYNDLIFNYPEMNCYRFFIAIDSHDIENAALKMIPKSDNLNILPHHSIINICGLEKGRISYEDLDTEYEKNNLVNCILEPGDAVIFDNIVIHGSSSNQSPLKRRALQLQFISNKLTKKENSVINNRYKLRSQFALDNMIEKIDCYKEKIQKLENEEIKIDSQLKLR